MQSFTTKVAVSALVMLFSPTLVRAQAAPDQEQVQGSGESRARTPEARIDAALSAAAEAKVPVSLIRSKIAEGEAKRIPPERIAAAVEARVQSLVRASQVMQRSDVEVRSDGELLVSADALDAGVSENALIRISHDAPPERRTVAIAVLTDLVRLGSASEQALARVSGAVSTSAALATLHAEVSAQLRRGGLQSTLEGTGIIRIP